MLTVIVPSFVAVDVLSREIPTNPSAEEVGCVALLKVISPVFFTSDLIFPIIPAVFLASKTIPLPFTAKPVFFIVDSLLEYIPTELSFVTLISPLFSATNFSLSFASFSVYIPTDDVEPTWISPAFSNVNTFVAVDSTFPYIPADDVALVPISIVALSVPFPSFSIFLFPLAKLVNTAYIPADCVFSKPILAFTKGGPAVTVLVALESLAYIPADCCSFNSIRFLFLSSELFSPKIAAEPLFSIVIFPVVSFVASLLLLAYSPTPPFILEIIVPTFIALDLFVEVPLVATKPIFVLVVNVLPAFTCTVEPLLATKTDVPLSGAVTTFVVTVVSKSWSNVTVEPPLA